ncbi:MAG: hypothetical protein EBZ66_00970 [Actinobacteria bacterium]|nr:hypothetical protein [Actinomycetota bacterium]
MLVGVLLVLISAVDIKYRIIPKRIIFLTFLLLIFKTSITSVFWAITLFLLYLLIFRFSKGALGYGDVRLAPLAGMMADQANPVLIHLFAWVLAGFYLVARGQLQSNLPFAPFFCISFITITHL